MGIISYLMEFYLKVHPKQSSAAGGIEDDPNKAGLKTVVHPSPHALHIVHSFNDVTTPWKRPAPPPLLVFRSLATDDVIGTESGDYMSSSMDDLKGVAVDKSEPHHPLNKKTWSKSRKGEKKDFPPPIGILTYMGGNGMAWDFRKQAIDGRLIMKAEIMKPTHHCFEAHRFNGRLTLKLLPAQDDAVSCDDECGCGHPIDDDEQSEDDECQGFDVEDCEGLRKEGMGCEEGLGQDLGPLWNGKVIDGPHGCLEGPTSTPLRPLATVACSQLPVSKNNDNSFEGVKCVGVA